MSSLDDNLEPPRSPSPSNGQEVTGVLAVTAFSATLDFDPEWSVSQVANDLRGRLSDSAQQLFGLDSPLGLCGLDIFKSASVQLGGLQKPITDVKADEEDQVKYLIMFDLPSDQANIVETYVNDNKENLAIARGDRLAREEDESKAKKRKGKNKNRAVESDTSQIYKVLQRLDEYDVKFAKQDQTNEGLQRLNEGLQRSNEGLQRTNVDLQKTVAELATNVARQTQILHALHRRVVLDQARDLIIDRYGFKISDLRLGGRQTQAERKAAFRSLVRSVREVLSPEDSDLLSDDALRMIFDGAKHTIRDAGNEVAHQASTLDISLAVLEGSLTQKQSEALSKIYMFTHNKEPQLE